MKSGSKLISLLKKLRAAWSVARIQGFNLVGKARRRGVVVGRPYSRAKDRAHGRLRAGKLGQCPLGLVYPTGINTQTLPTDQEEPIVTTKNQEGNIMMLQTRKELPSP